MTTSTDATRKIATLRRWAARPQGINPLYLAEIADEFARCHAIMVARGAALQAVTQQSAYCRFDDTTRTMITNAISEDLA